jgi:hypothetical protein
MAKKDWNQDGPGAVHVSDGTEGYWTDDFDPETESLKSLADDFADGYNFNDWTCGADEIALSVTVTNTTTGESESFNYRGSYFGMNGGAEDEN